MLISDSIKKRRPVAKLALLTMLTPALIGSQTLARSAGPDATAIQAPANGVSTDINQDIYGEWRITKLLDAAAITSITDRQAKAMLGKTASISKAAFKFNGEVCKSPTYERKVESLASSFREQGHVSAMNMELPDPVTSIDARCTSIYLKKPGVIVLHWEGYYFDAVKK